MTLLGDVGVGAVHVLGDRADLVLGEAVEGLGRELEVVGEVAGPGAGAVERAADRLEELGGAVRLDERERRRERARRVDAPHRLAAEELGAEVGDRVGDERAREQRLDLAVLARTRASPWQPSTALAACARS